MDENTYLVLKRIIREQAGVDLDEYKSQQMRRRLDDFAAHRAGAEVAAWVHALPQQPTELAALRDVLTINVSEFFRDPGQFEVLRTEILPDMLRYRSRLSIWSAACSRGQEPYSIAILLDEMGVGSNAHILATDLDRAVLAHARCGGPYTPNDLASVSGERRRRYFHEEPSGVYVAPEIRSRVMFREHSLLSGTYGANFDLIVCRNVLIYFATPAKTAIIHHFLAALRPGGVLFIGATEALLGADGEGYRRIAGNFYRKTEGDRSQVHAA